MTQCPHRPQPPKPAARPEKVSLWGYLKLFKQDILSAQPAKLYHAWMAEFRTPFFTSYMVNQPEIVSEVLKQRPDDFPKSDRIGEGLRPLLGESVFLTNGEVWKRQRRIIDPAFEGGRLKYIFPAMNAACDAAITRLQDLSKDEGQAVEIEELASFAAADVIFRTLFSIPITHHIATQVFEEFRRYQRTQPIVNLRAFIPIPNWFPRFFKPETKKSAAAIRGLIRKLTTQRMQEIENGTAPDDLATKIMTTPDPITGACFTAEEMIDQVAIFFLAGHETSASALSWALYLVARNPEVQDALRQEANAGLSKPVTFGEVAKLRQSKDVFREALRLYPPVPMMVRETTQCEQFRGRVQKTGAQIVISPWHMHRHERIWDAPDAFWPERYQTENGKACLKNAYYPFSAGARVCPGAGFAMIEGPLFLSRFVQAFDFSAVKDQTPIPVAHLTTRAKDGIHLWVQPCKS